MLPKEFIKITLLTLAILAFLGFLFIIYTFGLAIIANKTVAEVALLTLAATLSGVIFFALVNGHLILHNLTSEEYKRLNVVQRSE